MARAIALGDLVSRQCKAPTASRITKGSAHSQPMRASSRWATPTGPRTELHVAVTA